MPPRQVWLFQFGCWASVVTAVVHVAFSIAMPDRAAAMVMLLYGVCFAAVGTIGLVVARRGQSDPLLMYGVARSAAIVSTALLALSFTDFSIPLSMFIMAATTCFAVSAVKAPGI